MTTTDRHSFTSSFQISYLTFEYTATNSTGGRCLYSPPVLVGYTRYFIFQYNFSQGFIAATLWQAEKFPSSASLVTILDCEWVPSSSNFYSAPIETIVWLFKYETNLAFLG